MNIQSHLIKCFDNINKIKFLEEEFVLTIIGIYSADPESMHEYALFSQSVEIFPGDKVRKLTVGRKLAA